MHTRIFKTVYSLIAKRTGLFEIAIALMLSQNIAVTYSALAEDIGRTQSIRARDAGFGRGTQANKDAQGYLRRNQD
ncbi:hypothetical protein Tco_0200153 [Tanacetum coccineum]